MFILENMEADDYGSAKRRFADITNQQLNKIINEKDAKNTKRSTEQAVRLLRKYLEEKQLDVDFEAYSKQTLDKTLCKFFAEARTQDGTFYKKSSLQTLRHGLNRHLCRTSDIDIIKDTEFKESKKVFQAVCKDLKRQGFGGIEHHPPIDESDLKKMYEMFDLQNPKLLQWRVFCDIMLYFGRRGRENLRGLKINDFNCTTDGDDHRYIYINKDEQTKNHQNDENTASGRMYEIRDDDDLCPVKTFVRYKRKLNPKCVYLFQRPSSQPRNDVWYDNMPLGPNQLGSIMSEISKAFSLSQVYTNHSLRATTVHVLDVASIPGRHIMSVTGHKTESSLKTYTGYTTTKTKKKMSSIVSDSLRPSVVPAVSSAAYVDIHDNVGNDISGEVSFDLNTNDLVQLSSSEIDFLDAIVTDMDDDIEFDNLVSTMDLSSTVSTSNPQQVHRQHPVPSAPIIYNYGTITINYSK